MLIGLAQIERSLSSPSSLFSGLTFTSLCDLLLIVQNFTTCSFQSPPPHFNSTPLQDDDIMAIHPDYPDLTVQVIADGQPLREYDDEDADADPSVVTKYIEARTGSEFKITYDFAKSFPGKQDVRIRCKLDGSTVCKPLISKQSLTCLRGHKIDGIKAKEGSKWVLRMFCFSNLNIGKPRVYLSTFHRAYTDFEHSGRT